MDDSGEGSGQDVDREENEGLKKQIPPAVGGIWGSVVPDQGASPRDHIAGRDRGSGGAGCARTRADACCFPQSNGLES